MNVPNALTLTRFILIGLYPFLYFNEGLSHNKLWAFAVFLIAGLTDVLDGVIARRFGLVTKWGKLMDPLADKLMLITVLVCLFLDGVVSLWVIIIIALKELLMILGAAFLYKNRKVVVQANFYGKLATFLFYIAITALVFRVPYSGYILGIAVLSTILALIQYAALNFKRKSD
ncbi:MAG TPA: CDP-diacylglycerol--glycerol-3-phosphate 3-phosphatidyltransferase [Clostridiales bacterium]|nr:CDP-diacylglycerol--glycerol-3-phosphate 3-phosphatidyltransferase [Clostridiales bacterium]